MAITTDNTIVCAFDSMSDAQAAVQDLVQAGISRDQISLVANDNAGNYSRDLGTTGKDPNSVDGTTVGENLAAGTGIGALGGLLIGLGALAIPGVGPVIAAGPIAALIGGAVSGAVGGGLIGVLKKSGVPDEDAAAYDAHLRRGGALLTVDANTSDVDRINSILDRHNPIEVGDREEQVRNTGFDRPATTPAYTGTDVRRDLTGTDTPRNLSTSDQPLTVAREELEVGKRAVQRGGVRVFNRVIEEPVEQQVSLHDERVRVDRHPVDRPATEADFQTRGGTMEFTETVEEPVIRKRGRVVEEVNINKEGSDHTETVRDTVRRTEVDVEQLGAQGTGQTVMGDADADFRNDFGSRYGSTPGASYETYAPAYQYGSRMASDPIYRGQSFNDVESTLRTDYMRNNPNSTWDNIKGAVRYGWEKVSGKR